MPNRKKLSSAREQENSESVLLFTGEHSGDLLARDLLTELQRAKPNAKFFGVGGERCIEAGLESLEDLEKLAVVGFSEGLRKYFFLRKLFYRILKEVEIRKVQLAILVDYPGFNLRLAKELKKRGIKVVFYVSPQIWAWKFNRIFFIKENVDLMLTLFQFEESLYKSYGVKAIHVGHPLVKRIPEKLLQEPRLKETLEIKRNDTVVGLLPGSRNHEIRSLTKPILETAGRIYEHLKSQGKNTVFLLPNINKKQETFLKKRMDLIEKRYPGIQIHYTFDASLSVMQESDVLLIASGTATLEGLFFKKPMVILYKVSWITYVLGTLLMRSKFFGLVNILSQEEVCLELFQNECTPDRIFQEAKLILENTSYRKKMEEKLKATKARELDIEDSSVRARDAILEIWETLPSPD